MLPSCLILVLALAGAADKWPVERGPSREPEPYRFDFKAVKAIPKALLDDSAAVVLYAAATYRVETDGTIEHTTHELTRLGSRKSIERLGEFRNISYTPSYQKLTLHDARIHKPSGKVIEIEPRHVHLRDVGTDYQVYDTDKQLIISFPGLEVGDVLEAKWTVRGKNPEHHGQFFQRYNFGDTSYPVLIDDLRVLMPKDRPLKFALKPGLVAARITATQTEKDGWKTYRWVARDCPAAPQDDNLPSREELRAMVQLSTFTSWEQVGKWKAKLRASCWTCTPKVKEVVAEVTKGLKTPTEKARALTYWVRRNVRYVSAGERHDYTPHPPETVLGNRAGDCKDSSQLLAVMLREIGLPVELVTLGTLDDGQIDPAVPSPWGTHAILAVTIDRKVHWIDTTARLCGWDELPRDDLGRMCYLTDEKGKLRLLRTPPAAPDHRRTETVTEVWIDEDGNTRNRRTILSWGLSALAQRDRYVEVPPGERRRLVTSALQDSNSRTRLVKLMVDEASLIDQDRPVKVEMEYEVPRLFTGTSERDGSFTDSNVWGRFLAYTIDHERKVPMVLPSAFRTKHTYRVHLPAGWVLDGLPRNKAHKAKWGQFSCRVRELDDERRAIEVVTEMRLDQPRVEVADLEAFREFYDNVHRDYRTWVTLKPAASLSSAPRLEKFLKDAPANTAASKALARIYLKNGKLADARRVLEAAGKHAPEDDELVDLRLEAAETDEQEEAARREQMKRHPDQRKYALGLAAVLVNRGKQDEARAVLAGVVKTGSGVEKARAHYQLARSHYRRDELRPALEQLDLAAKVDAETVNTIRAWRLRAQVLEELKRPGESLTAYRKAWEQDRTNDEVALSVIRLAIETKDDLTALDHLRRYVVRNGRNVPALVLAAKTYLRMGRLDEALEAALRSREINFHEGAQRVIGLVHLRRGDFEKARDHLDRAEMDAVVAVALARATVLSSRLRELPGVLDRAAKLDAPPEALARMRRVLERRKELDVPGASREALDAVACAEYAWQAGLPDRAEALLKPAAGQPIGAAHALRARLALERGRLRAALEDAERAIALSPKAALGHLVRGRVRLERGTAGYLDDLTRAVELTARKDAECLQALAEGLEAAGKVSEALKVIREAVALRPKDRALAELLSRLERKRS